LRRFAKAIASLGTSVQDEITDIQMGFPASEPSHAGPENAPCRPERDTAAIAREAYIRDLNPLAHYESATPLRVGVWQYNRHASKVLDRQCDYFLFLT
jgi:hypothetical protein